MEDINYMLRSSRDSGMQKCKSQKCFRLVNRLIFVSITVKEGPLKERKNTRSKKNILLENMVCYI